MIAMTPEDKNQWLPVAVIAGALAAWGLLLAVGAWLAPSDPGATRDFRKLWVVAAMVAVFLTMWGGVLWARARRVRRQRAEAAKNSGSEAGQLPRQTPE